MFRILAAGIAATALTLSAPAQRRAAADSPRALTEEQVEARLEALKSGLLLQVLPDDKRGLPLQTRRWMDDFHAIQTDHYLMFTNSSRSMANKFSRALEEIHAFVQKEFPFEDIDVLLPSYVFNVNEEYYRFCQAVVGWSRGQAENSGGHAFSRDNGEGLSESYYATYYMSPTASVVTHEASHQVVDACLQVPGVGSWFQEGIATYLEKVKANDKPSSMMRTDLRNGNYYPLETFLGIQSMLRSPLNAATNQVDPRILAERNYDHAGAFIDFLVNTKQEPVADRFPQVLEAFRKAGLRERGVPLATRVFGEVYGLSLEELEQVWKRHHRVRR